MGETVDGGIAGDSTRVCQRARRPSLSWHEDVESSGLALDVLVHHVTEFDTAAQRTRAELAARYPHRAELLSGLLDKLQYGYLLIEADARPEPSAPAVPSTRLAQDTLAPLVHARFRTSVSPGQRARRLLENRAPEWQDGKAGSVLDATDLASVEVGAAGMRARHPKQSGWNQRQIAIALDAGERTVSR